MPITEAACQVILAALNRASPVTSRKMFGGLGLYRDGVFFAVVDDDRLYFKSDAETDPVYDALGAESWVIQGDVPSPMPYREVSGDVQADPDRLKEFMDSAVAVALRKKSLKRKR